MLDLPEIGDRVTIWPFPGRNIQDGPRPLDFLGGGRWLPAEGKEVTWSEFHLEQYRAGDLLLHAPPVAAPAKVKSPAPAKERKPEKTEG